MLGKWLDFNMTKEKVTEVLELYRNKLNEVEKDEVLTHCLEMIDKIEVFLKEDKLGKSFRWLGFIQGCFWSKNIYSLDEMKLHNKSI